MPPRTSAAHLLESLTAESPAMRDAVASAAGVTLDRAVAAMSGQLRLSLSEQLRLSEAAAVLAPDFTTSALELRAQVLDVP